MMLRRSLLRSAGLALAIPATALARATAAPVLASPEARARRSYAEFADAMNELAAGVNGGWFIMAGERKPFGTLAGGAWASPMLIRYEMKEYDRRLKPMAIERHENLPFELLDRSGS